MGNTAGVAALALSAVLLAVLMMELGQPEPFTAAFGYAAAIVLATAGALLIYTSKQRAK
jgi:hypothetical protein